MSVLCWSREASWREEDSKVLLSGLFLLHETASGTVSEIVIETVKDPDKTNYMVFDIAITSRVHGLHVQ